MLVYLRNLKRRHSVDSFVHIFGGKQSNGKPVCRYERLATKGLVSYWIVRLEAVLDQLKAIEKGARHVVVIPQAIADMSVSEVYGVDIGQLITKRNANKDKLVIKSSIGKVIAKEV